MLQQDGSDPFPHESLTSYLRRKARSQFFTDTIAFVRAGGVEWHDRSRDPDLVSGVLLQQLAAFLELEHDRVARLTVQPHLCQLADEDRASMRWWTRLIQRSRMCDRCVLERPFGRLEWRFPVVTDCLIHRRPLLDECGRCGALRDRSSRRWERFDCGHHVQRSAGANSQAIDLRIQQAIQASLGLGRSQPKRFGAWLIHAAVLLRPRPVEVQSVRHSLRELWVEHRRVRLAWRGPAQALRILEQRGERMYPTQREPPPPESYELVPPSPDELRDTAARFRLLEERSSSASGTPVAAMANPALVTSSTL